MKPKDLLTGSDMEPGVYRLKLQELNAGEESQTSGKPMVRIVWAVADGEYDGRKLSDNIVLDEKVGWKWAQLWVALGGDPEQDFGTLKELANATIAMAEDKETVYAKVFKQEWQGVYRPKIAEYLHQDMGQVLIGAQERKNSDVPF